MIDQTVRKQMLRLIHNLSAKQAFNLQVKDPWSLLKSKLLVKGIWPFYEDFQHYKTVVESNALSARIMLFLHSDLIYRWPIVKKRFDLCFILAMVLLLFLLKMRLEYWVPVVLLLTISWNKGKQLWRRWIIKKQAGELAVWPFFTLQEYEHVSANPTVLSKKE